MKDLHSAGVVLRNLKPGLDYEKLLTDLNYNFVQILKSPGFKGTPGDSIIGPPGESTRGSRWIFIDVTKFKEVYPTIQTADQINLLFINSEFSSDPEKLFSAVYIPNDTQMILGDTLVLPSGIVLELVERNNNVLFIDTGVTFSQIAQLTKEEVQQMIIDYFESMMGQNKNGFKHYKAEAKNANDSQPSLNTNYTNGSVVDIDVDGSGPGYQLTSYTFIAPDETNVTETTKLLVLAGSAKRYHQLIQGSQTDLTNAYAPQVNTFPGLTVLQNNYENGIIFGNQNEANFRKFGRLYRTASAVILTSSFSPFANEYSDIQITDSEFRIRSTTSKINSTNLEFSGTNIKSNAINAVDKVIKIGGNLTLDTDQELVDNPKYATKKVILSSTDEIYLRSAGLAGATIVSLDANYKVSSTYKIVQAINNNAFEVPSSAAIYSALRDIDSRFLAMENRVFFLENHAFAERSWIVVDVDLNRLIQHGAFGIRKSQTILNLPEFYQNPNLTNIPPPASVINNDYFLNVFRHKTGSTTYTLTQELYVPYPYNYSTKDLNEQRFVRYHRRGTMVAGNDSGTAIIDVKWGAWNRIVDGLDTLVSGNSSIEISGSFHENNLTVKHAAKSLALHDQNYAGTTTVLQSVTFDQQGHPTKVDPYDIATDFVKKTDYDFDGLFAMYESIKTFMSAFTNGGGMVLWNKPFNEIPQGWREVADWRGRLPMGYDPTQTEFNMVGKYGGAKAIVQTIQQMPKHAHLMPYQIVIASEGQAKNQAYHRVNGNYVDRYSYEAGGSEAMNILNPYRVVVFIELIH